MNKLITFIAVLIVAALILIDRYDQAAAWLVVIAIVLMVIEIVRYYNK